VATSQISKRADKLVARQLWMVHCVVHTCETPYLTGVHAGLKPQDVCATEQIGLACDCHARNTHSRKTSAGRFAKKIHASRGVPTARRGLEWAQRRLRLNGTEFLWYWGSAPCINDKISPKPKQRHPPFTLLRIRGKMCTKLSKGIVATRWY
jgi:hypothetical protein